jgi:hypothetical protein
VVPVWLGVAQGRAVDERLAIYHQKDADLGLFLSTLCRLVSFGTYARRFPLAKGSGEGTGRLSQKLRMPNSQPSSVEC